MPVLDTCKFKEVMIKTDSAIAWKFSPLSLWDFIAIVTRVFNWFLPKILCSQFLTLKMLHAKFDQDWSVSLGDI